jgi:hypothetical protein
MSAEATISNLVKVANHSRDPESLWQIAMKLTELGAWTEAKQVEQMARTAEAARDRAQAVRA